MELRASKSKTGNNKSTTLTMAKLFKTISLEDRYKNSNHLNQVVKPKSVTQGTVVLQSIKSTKEFESILLKSLPSAQEKNSIILKSIKGNIDITKKAPTISLVFRSPIGLVDRIKQPYTKPIAQSPAIGLSDLYNNLIKITPFGILNQISKVVVKPATTILSQGLSYITVNIPTYDSLLLQGTFFNSGAYYSNIVPIISITSQQLSQGTTQALSTPVLTASVLLAQGTTLQGGSITTVQPSSSTNVILLKYGNYWFLNQLQITRPLEFLTQSKDFKLQKPRNLIKLVNVEIYAPNKILKQGTIKIRNNFPTRFQPKREGPILRLAGFAADRALAYFSPRVKHGSADLSNEETSSGWGTLGYFTTAGILFSGNTFDETNKTHQDRSSDLEIMTKAMRTFEAPTPIKMGEKLDEYLLKPKLNSPTDLNTLNHYKVDYKDLAYDINHPGELIRSDKQLPLNDENVLKILEKNSRPFATPGAETPSSDNNKTEQPPTIGISSIEGNKLAANGKKDAGSDYATLTYNKIQSKGESTTPGTIGRDFRELAVDNADASSHKPKFIPYSGDDKGSTELKSPLHQIKDGDDDFIELSIGTIRFRAYITAFSDGVTTSWFTPEPGLGEFNAVRTPEGITRSGNVSFKVASLTQSDYTQTITKLRSLANVTRPFAVSGSNGNTIWKAPQPRIVVGNLFNEYCYIDSVKFDIQPSDYSWDIDYKIPQIIDVAISFGVKTGNDSFVNKLEPFVSLENLNKKTKLKDG